MAFNSQYYTCEQIDQRLLQGYLDDYNEQNHTNLTKEEFLTLLNEKLIAEKFLSVKSTQNLTDAEKQKAKGNLGIGDIIHIQETTGTVTLKPNILYILDNPVGNIYFELSGSILNSTCEYMIEFKGGSSSSVNFPADTRWLDGNTLDDVKENYTYQVSILNGLAVFGEFEPLTTNE